MTRVLLESYALLIAGWVPVQFALIAVWSWRRQRAFAWAVWLGFAALPLLLVLSWAIETSRERLIRECRDLARFVEAGDVAAIAARLDDSFRAGEHDADSFTERLRRVLANHQVREASLGFFAVEFPTPNRGVAEVTANARVRGTDLVYEFLTSRWRLTFRRSEAGWTLAAVESLPVPPFNFRGVEDWLR